MESRSLLRLVRYHWAVIVVCVLLGLVVGQALVATSTREYTASADVNVTVTGGTSTGEIAQSANFSQQQARNFSAIATRQVVLEPVIDTLDLDVSVDDLRKQVSTSVPLNTSIITISATDESPERAAAIANAVASTLAEVVPALTPRVDGESPVRLQVIESAAALARPSSPNVPLLLIVGVLAGLIAATAIVVLRGVVDARVRTRDDATQATGAAIVGAISIDRRSRQQPIAQTNAGHSLRAEEFRQLRTNLRFLQTGNEKRLFAVTSSIAGEGKSNTAANTAVALAASGVSVCLVEVDLRRPSLADLLGLPAGIGVTSVTLGDVTLDDALQTWGSDGLHVLLSGPVPPNPSEILESQPMHDLLARLRERFDVVILDCPPLNPVSDASVLARYLGGVLVVVGVGKVRVRELRRAVERLDAVGAHVEGVILNLVRVSESRAYRYSAYTANPTSRPLFRRPDRQRRKTQGSREDASENDPQNEDARPTAGSGEVDVETGAPVDRN